VNNQSEAVENDHHADDRKDKIARQCEKRIHPTDPAQNDLEENERAIYEHKIFGLRNYGAVNNGNNQKKKAKKYIESVCWLYHNTLANFFVRRGANGEANEVSV
jgi:hypothetical protein